MIRRDLLQAHGAKARLKRALQASLELLYPPRCAGCGRVDADWCETCQRELDRSLFDVQPRPLPPLTAIAATGTHEGKLQDAIHALKYEGALATAAPLGERLVQALNALEWQVDVILPVPLHTKRQHERGMNQAEKLAIYVAETLNITYNPTILHRWRDTPPQVGMNRQQRQANVRGAFSASAAISGRVLLVDDVFTTGATLQACAHAALEAGATLVYGLTVSAARSPMDRRSKNDGHQHSGT